MMMNQFSFLFVLFLLTTSSAFAAEVKSADDKRVTDSGQVSFTFNEDIDLTKCGPDNYSVVLQKGKLVCNSDNLLSTDYWKVATRGRRCYIAKFKGYDMHDVKFVKKGTKCTTMGGPEGEDSNGPYALDNRRYMRFQIMNQNCPDIVCERQYFDIRDAMAISMGSLKNSLGKYVTVTTAQNPDDARANDGQNKVPTMIYTGPSIPGLKHGQAATAQ